VVGTNLTKCSRRGSDNSVGFALKAAGAVGTESWLVKASSAAEGKELDGEQVVEGGILD
jgi:hypothetical protein